MWRRVALARTCVWKEYIASIIRIIRNGELGKKLVATSNRSTLRRNKKSPLYKPQIFHGVLLISYLRQTETAMQAV
jgi:hypothetical protein